MIERDGRGGSPFLEGREQRGLRGALRVGAGLLFAAVLGLGVPVQAGIYKWVDESGKVHYSDKPPAADAEEMDVKVAPSSPSGGVSDAERREKLKRLLDAFDKERAEKQALAEQTREEKHAREEECARMRDELAELKAASYLYDYDEAGNKVIYTDEERAAATAEYEAAYAKHC